MEGYELAQDTEVETKEMGRFWRLRHMLQEAKSCYVEYNLVKQGNGKVLCFGYTPALSYPKGIGRKEREVLICNYTAVFPEDFDLETTCPNGALFAEYKVSQKFEELMWSKNTMRPR